jgi:hypothetical protein
MLFLKLRGRKGFLQLNNYWNRAVQNMGQLCCHTELPAVLRRTRINCALQSHWLQTIKRLARTKRAAGFLYLQEILLGRKIGRLKKTKTGGAVCKARFGSTWRCRSLGSLARAGLAQNKLDRSPRAKFQVSS